MARLRQPQPGFWKSVAGSLILHALVISAALFAYKGEPRVFFTPAYTVDLVRGPAAAPKREEPREMPPSRPAPREEPPKAAEKKAEPEKADEKAVRLKIKEEPKEPVSEALSRIKESVRIKEEKEALASSIERIRKKKETEAKENAGKLEELRKRLLARESSGKTIDRGPSVRPGPAQRTDVEARYPAYYGLIRDRVQENWTGIEEYGDNVSVIVSIRIARNGELLSSWVEKSSGNQRFDRTLLNAIKKASPFPPLPHEFDGDYLETGLRFCPGCPI